MQALIDVHNEVTRRYFVRLGVAGVAADWTDADVLPPPENWGGGLPDGKLPPIPRQFDEATGKPLQWPLRNAIAHWAALLPALSPGKYFLRCRAVDGAGNAQLMPRPFGKAGRNAIQELPLTVS